MKKINGLRFIVGNGCNYNCFYCHHEGYYGQSNQQISPEKLAKIADFTRKYDIRNISITGGEPLLYWLNTKQILTQFNDEYYVKTLNSNLSLVNQYIEELKKFNPIEWHVNLSSLNPKTHELIIGGQYLAQVLENLALLKTTPHKICLNIPVIKGINYAELKELYDYAQVNGFIPRFLILMPVTECLDKYVVPMEDILTSFGGGDIVQKYSYGLYKGQTPAGVIDISKCLCHDHECDICKENTFMHLTPELDIKYCMQSDDVVPIDFTNDETIADSFAEANKRLELIHK